VAVNGVSSRHVRYSVTEPEVATFELNEQGSERLTTGIDSDGEVEESLQYIYFFPLRRNTIGIASLRS
jgi:hypothetical protein